MDTPTIRITRELVAQWYGLSLEGLRYRFRECGVKIKRRVFTIDDVRYIISELGIPPFLPSNILPA